MTLQETLEREHEPEVQEMLRNNPFAARYLKAFKKAQRDLNRVGMKIEKAERIRKYRV